MNLLPRRRSGSPPRARRRGAGDCALRFQWRRSRAQPPPPDVGVDLAHHLHLRGGGDPEHHAIRSHAFITGDAVIKTAPQLRVSCAGPAPSRCVVRSSSDPGLRITRSREQSGNPLPGGWAADLASVALAANGPVELGQAGHPPAAPPLALRTYTLASSA